ncbi:hypothetical protein Tcan_07241 [Toxocara canis]|uniref:Chondroitin proteoglycan 4 domain-containing protein n=1 Tax=Toxocara canis TaxID=6265 RepID=A0A0B2UUF1_TOXCA|nr:hypothetical protein Tcan_07241 [Toxocara canis]
MLAAITTLLLSIFVCNAAAFDDSKLSPCLRVCLKPIVNFERTYAYQFKNFEKVCDKLEAGAHCSRKCDLADQRAFYHYTTFYRLHCVDFQEELEEHLECLTEIAPQIDNKCRAQCVTKFDKNAGKEVEVKNKCKAVECSTVCYYQEFSNACPGTHDILLRINMRQINDVISTATPEAIQSMHEDCLRLYDMDYMRRKLLGEPDL